MRKRLGWGLSFTSGTIYALHAEGETLKVGEIHGERFRVAEMFFLSLGRQIFVKPDAALTRTISVAFTP